MKNSTTYKVSGGALSALFLTAAVLSAQTTNTSSVSANDWFQGTPSSLANFQSSTGHDINTTFLNSGLGNATAYAQANVDTTTNASGDPILRAQSRVSSTSSFNNLTDSVDSIARAESYTVFRAGSGSNPVGTNFSASFDFMIDGVFTFNLGGGSAQPIWSTFSGDPYFAPGDQARMSFTLFIKPVDDSIAETTAGQSISFGAEVIWDANGFAGAQSLDIEDGLTFSVLGTASETITPNGSTEMQYALSGSVPFTSVVGREYEVSMSLQTDASVRGSSGTPKTIKTDFLNSASAQPTTSASGFDFTVVPEPSHAGVVVAFSALSLALARRRRA